MAPNYMSSSGGAGAPRSRVSDPGAKASSLDLSEQVERQNLLLQSLLRLLVEKGVIEEAEFEEWVKYVDEFDGRRDGKLAADKGIRACPGCGRVNGIKAHRCMYCSADLGGQALARDRSAGPGK